MLMFSHLVARSVCTWQRKLRTPFQYYRLLLHVLCGGIPACPSQCRSRKLHPSGPDLGHRLTDRQQRTVIKTELLCILEALFNITDVSTNMGWVTARPPDADWQALLLGLAPAGCPGLLITVEVSTVPKLYLIGVHNWTLIWAHFALG